MYVWVQGLVKLARRYVACGDSECGAAAEVRHVEKNYSGVSRGLGN